MEKTLAIAAISLFVLTTCTAKPVEKSQLELLAINAKAVAENVTSTLGLQDLSTQKVVKTLNKQTQLLADRVQAIVDKLNGEIKAHQGDADDVLKRVQAKLAETAESLKTAAGPENAAKFQDLKAKFDDGFKSAVAEVEKLVKTAQPKMHEAKKNVDELAKAALDQLLEIGRNIQTQVNAAVVNHEKTHKN